MTLTHVSKVFAVRDGKIRPMIADNGGATTYATALDVPGLKSVGISGDVNTKELRGDNALLDSQTTITSLKVEFEFAKIDLDVLKSVAGGAVVDSGVTPNQVASWQMGGQTLLPYFGFECLSIGADTIGGSVGFRFPKVVLNGFPDLGLAEEDFQTVKIGGAPIPALSGKPWIEVFLHETVPTLPFVDA